MALNIRESFAWAFRAVAQNPLTWIAYALFFGFLSVVSLAAEADSFVESVTIIILALLQPVIIAAALEQTVNPKVRWPTTGTYWLTLLTGIVVGFAFIIVFGIAGSVVLLWAVDVDTDAAVAAALLINLLAVWLIYPFFLYPLYYSADAYENFSRNISLGFKAGKEHFWKSAALIAVIGVAGLVVLLIGAALLRAGVPDPVAFGVTSVLAGFGIVVAALAVAHVYRQITGDEVTAP